MNFPKVCRICLITNVKLKTLEPHQLSYLDTIIANPFYVIELPPYACYECSTLLEKSFSFKEKCVQGQTVLIELIHKYGELTTDLLNTIDRNELNLQSSLTYHCITNDSIINIYHKQLDIKVEDKLLQELYFEVKEELELDYDGRDLSNNVQDVSSDDEPLLVHKTAKDENVEEEERVQVKARKKKRLVNNEVVHVQEDQSVELDSAQEYSIKKIKKRKLSSKNKRIKEDINSRRTVNTGGVNYNRIELEKHVTIINLSIEDQLAEIEARKESNNYKNAPFKCEKCYKGFIDEVAWQHHQQKHSLISGEIECLICKLRFKTNRHLQKHQVNHATKYICRSCPFVSATSTLAKQHLRWHQGVTYKCQYCNEVSDKWTSYLSHVRMKHPSSHICHICGYSFVSQLGLTMHKSIMHKDYTDEDDPDKLAGPYCETCDVKFVSNEAYNRHLLMSNKHNNQSEIKGCRACGEIFPTQEEYKRHHRKEHAKKRPKNYGKKPHDKVWPDKCLHCEEIISDARAYWAHFRRMHRDLIYPIEKSHTCDVCGKSFRANAFLVYHKQTHNEERTYKCATCPKAFFTRNSLLIHERNHSDVRPHQCTVCLKAFKNKGALNRHFRVHTGDKPYSCEFCGKSFTQSNSCKIHVRTVHLKQPTPYLSKNRQDKVNKNQMEADRQFF